MNNKKNYSLDWTADLCDSGCRYRRDEAIANRDRVKTLRNHRMPTPHCRTNAVVATFFHGETRCPTCRKIENYAHQAIKEGFADKLASGEIQWRAVNYEAPANKHYATDYEIYSSTVVLVRTIEGKPADWRNLERVWDFVDDEEAFKKYVRAEAQEMLSL